MSTRTWFITGVNSGLGRALTEQLLDRGERVAGTVRDPAAMQEQVALYPGQLWLARLDLTDTAEIRPVVDEAFAHFGRVEVIVNNAGYGLMGAAEEVTDAQVQHHLATNLLGSIQVTRAAIPHLRNQGGGRIIQISSFGGQAAFPGGSLYHAGKWGVEGFTEALIGELAPFGIGVTIVEPGGARTNFRHGGAQIGPAMEVYRDNPAGIARRLIEGDSVPQGDPFKMATAILATVEQSPAPKRLVLGSDAFGILRSALTERLDELVGQEELAHSTDAGDFTATASSG